MHKIQEEEELGDAAECPAAARTVNDEVGDCASLARNRTPERRKRNLPDQPQSLSIRLLVIVQQRNHVVLLKSVAALEKVEFHHERKPGDVGPQRSGKFRGSFGRSSGRQQIVDN
jgi:hypothetical protein